MAASLWKGQLEFGLVGCPVSFEKIQRAADATPESHMEHKTCKGVKITRPWACGKCGTVDVPYTDLVKVFDDGTTEVAVTADEVKGALLDAKSLTVETFIDASDIDPAYLAGHVYWLHFDRGKNKASNGGLFAYSALVTALVELNKFAIASWSNRGRDYVVVLRPYTGPNGEQILIAQRMEYGELIQPMYTDLETVAGTQELDLLKQLINAKSEKFDATKYESKYAERLRGLLAEKAQSGGSTPSPSAPAQPVEEDELVKKLRESLSAA